MYDEIKECRCCGNDNLFKYLDLGKQPLANSYHKGEKLPEVPLEVNLCRNCWHSQLSVVVDPEVMFKNYLYVSGTTGTFQMHCRKLAHDAVDRFEKNKTLDVLDIAVNDGLLLEFFKDIGCKVFGVDPAENLRKITEQKGIDVLVDYWGINCAKKLQRKFDIITGTNVFAHVHDNLGFLMGCEIALKDNGIVILEFPYCKNTMKEMQFDQIYHEHLSYFTANSFTALVNRTGFVIVDVLQTPIHGGSIRFFLKKRVSSTDSHCSKITDLIVGEAEQGLHSEDTYKAFATQVEKNKKDLRVLLEDLRKKNIKVVGYGASAKGNTMLNAFSVDLAYIVDDNPMKWGYLTPGRNIPITSPDDLAKEEKNVAILVLAWNFMDEIRSRVSKLRPNKSDYFLTYVPKVRIL